MKTCNTCHKEYPETLEYFPPHKLCHNGLGPACRECHRAYMREWKRANSDRLAARRRELYAEHYGPIQRGKEKARRDAAPLRFRATIMRKGMIDRAKARGIPCDSQVLTVAYIMDWIRQTPNCPCCGKPLDYGYKEDATLKDNSPSIDRFIPGKGYVLGNVAIICWRCNNLKRDATIEELEAVVHWMKSHASFPQ